jgi:RNA polymerase sigma-70 factor, ECF subfamily
VGKRANCRSVNPSYGLALHAVNGTDEASMRIASLRQAAPQMLTEERAEHTGLKRELDAFLRGVERRALKMAELSTGLRDDAMDVVQDAMHRFVRSYSGKPTAEWPLLFWRVLDSRIVDFHRRRTVRSRWMAWLPASDDELEAADPLDSVRDEGEPGPLSRLGDADALVAIENALRQLPLRQRQTFLLRVWNGMDVSQTAAIMQLTEGSVKTHLFRALQQLRARLEEHRD